MLNDFRSATRSLRRSPALVAVAVLPLAVGIGANVSVFSVVREMILDDLSARRPEQLVDVDGVDVSYPLYRELRLAGTFEDLAFNSALGDRIWQAEGRNEIVWTLPTSANFFDVLGIAASRGRLYSQADEGREFAILSYGFWHRRLHEDASVLGQPIRLNDKLYTVLGVLPRDYRSVFGHGVSPEVYLSDVNPNPQDHRNSLFGRLHHGVSREETSRALVAAVERLQGKDPSHRNIQLRPKAGLAAAASSTGDDRRLFLFFVALFLVAAALMLIACSNVAGLLLARALHRRRELAIRKALGANRLQLLRPLLAEGFLLVVCGAGFALVLDTFLRERLSYIRWPTAYAIPFEFHFQNDSGLLLYGSLVAFAALLLSSLLPALRSADADISLVLKQGEPPFSVRRLNLRSGFVTLQIVLSIVLLTLGGLFMRSLLYLVAIGPGFDVAHTLIAVPHTLERYSGDGAWEFRQKLVRRVAVVPGVVAVTSTDILPLMGELRDGLLRLDERPLSTLRHTYAIGAGENYCAAMGIPILRGRDFAITDRGRKPIPVIVNRTLAREFFADHDPIGQYLITAQEERLQVIGVAADSRMRTLGEAGVPVFFRPEFNGQLLVRVSGDPRNWLGPLRNALGHVDGTAALDVRPLAEAAAGALFPLRAATGFLGSFSILGMALAVLGLYWSVSYAVDRRTREFGIRAALGATRSTIIRTALRDAMAVLLCGAIIGVPLSLLAIRPLTDLIPDGVNPWDPAPFLAVVLLLLGAGLLAGWIPACRASRIQPSLALRED